MYMSTLCSIYNTSLCTMFRVRYCTEPSALICWSFVKTVMVLNDRTRDNATYNWPCVKTGSRSNLVPKPRGNSLPAIRYEPHMKTSQSIAANCLRRIACGELPVFRKKKPKDNRTWVADQEPVNMKRLEP